MPVWVFVSYLHHIVKQYHTSAIVILILYNRSINTLIVCYFRHNVVCFAQFFQRKYKDKAELFVFEQHSSISFLNPRFEWIEWTVRLVGFEAALHRSISVWHQCVTSKVPREWFKSTRSSLIALAVLWCHTPIGLMVTIRFKPNKPNNSMNHS